jgi:hypothetical protein
MIRCQIRLHPVVRYHFQGLAAPLTKETLEQLIEGAVVHQIDDYGFGHEATVDLQLAHTPDVGTLNTILAAVERCGYTLLEGEVEQWVDAQTQGALIGFASGAGVGAPTKNEALMLAFGLAGALLGHYAGTQIQKHEVVYQIRSAYRGGPVELVEVNDAKAPNITLADWFASAHA